MPSLASPHFGKVQWRTWLGRWIKSSSSLRPAKRVLLRVFAARASLLQARRAELDALNELTQAAAAVTLVTGLPPEALLAPNQTPSSP